MRMFIAVPVEPTEEIEKFVAKLRRIPGVKAVPSKNLHVTLSFIGEAQPEKIIPFLESLDHDLFSVPIRGVGVFPSRSFIRVVWLGLPGFESFCRYLRSLKWPGQVCDVPHLTVARVKPGVNKKALLQLVDEFANAEFGFLCVDRVVLYESVLKVPHPEYRPLYVKKLG